MPKASALRFHQSNGSTARAEPCRRSGNTHGFCVTAGLPPIASEPTPSPRLWATSPGATPARLCEHTMEVERRSSKPELSTWLGIGTFYLAPTRGRSHSPRQRALWPEEVRRSGRQVSEGHRTRSETRASVQQLGHHATGPE